MLNTTIDWFCLVLFLQKLLIRGSVSKQSSKVQLFGHTTPEVKQTDKKLGISLEMRNVTLLIISRQYLVSGKCPLLAPIGPAHSGGWLCWPEVCTAVLLAFLLWEVPSCATQSNPAAVAASQPAWCYSQQKMHHAVGHIPQSGCLRFVFSQFEQSF